MEQSEIADMTKRMGVADLPLYARFHFVKASLAEMAGNTELAEIELTRAVEAEAKAAQPVVGKS
jgi:hypothetical protein